MRQLKENRQESARVEDTLQQLVTMATNIPVLIEQIGPISTQNEEELRRAIELEKWFKKVLVVSGFLRDGDIHSKSWQTQFEIYLRNLVSKKIESDNARNEVQQLQLEVIKQKEKLQKLQAHYKKALKIFDSEDEEKPRISKNKPISSGSSLQTFPTPVSQLISIPSSSSASQPDNLVHYMDLRWSSRFGTTLARKTYASIHTRDIKSVKCTPSTDVPSNLKTSSAGPEPSGQTSTDSMTTDGAQVSTHSQISTSTVKQDIANASKRARENSDDPHTVPLVENCSSAAKRKRVTVLMPDDPGNDCSTEKTEDTGYPNLGQGSGTKPPEKCCKFCQQTFSNEEMKEHLKTHKKSASKKGASSKGKKADKTS